MRIITVSRQFGSGGRELGRRLADVLGYDYYDREIIESLAEEQGMDAEHVRYTLSHHGWYNVRLTYRNRFSHLGFDHSDRTRLLLRQKEIIKEIAEAGNNCIIVGRDADIILHDYKPFRLYICADLSSRLARCMRFENKKPEAERLSEKVILKNIRLIDKERGRTREILTGKLRGDGSMFDLTVNASGWDSAALASALAAFSERFFGQNETGREAIPDAQQEQHARQGQQEQHGQQE